MRVNFVLIVFAFFGDYTLAQNDGSCDITDVSVADWAGLKRIDINDTQVNTSIFQSAYTGTLTPGTITATLETGNINDLTKVASYFQLSTDSNTLILSTTSVFGNLDEDAYTNGSSTLVLNIQCPMTCDGGTSNLRLMISVEDVNNHAPTFTVSSYEYNVPMPIMPRIDFTIYGDAIEATDLDFSNNNITFTITPADFTITTTQVANKQFRAVFSTVSTLQLTGNTTYGLTATDSGTPQQSTTTTLVVTVDSETSLDSPSFLSNPYRFNYSVNANGDGVLEQTSDITALTNRPTSITNVSLVGDYKDYFSVQSTAADEEVTFALSVQEPLPSDADSVVVLTLSFETDAVASTTILVYTSTSSNDIAPEFDNLYYVGSYISTDNTVIMENNITVTSATETVPNVTVSGENSDYFKVACDKTSSCTLTVTPLTEEIISTTSELLLTLTATQNGGSNSSHSILVVRLPAVMPPAFSKLYYSAKYLVNGTKGTVELDDEIVIDNIDAGSMTIDFENYKDNFHISYSDSKWNITVKELLSNDTIKSNSILNIILTASEKTNSSITAKAVLGLKLPQDNALEAPTFGSLYYTGEYNKSDSTVKLNEEITINSTTIPSVTVSGDSSEYFQVVCTSSSCTLTAKTLPDDVLSSNSELLLKLVATEEDTSGFGEAVLIVKLPEQILPTFSKLYYYGEYSVSGDTGSITLTDQITLENIDAKSVKIALDSYTDNFEVVYDTTWTVKVKSPLTDDVINSNSQLIIILTGTSTSDSNITTKSVLVLKMPAVNTSEDLKFTKIVFEAEYVTNSTTPQVSGDAITVASKNNSAVHMSLDSKYEPNFKIEYSSSEDSWSIKIVKALNDTVLKAGSDLILTLTAIEDGSANTAQAALVIKLPSTNENEDAPKFAGAYYLGEYKVQDDTASVQMEKNIEITYTDMSEISITLDSYTENFEVVYDNSEWTVNIKTPLTADILNSYSQLIITLTATLMSDTTITTQSALVLKLPSANTSEDLKFTKIVFEAEYVTNSTTPQVLGDDITVKSTNSSAVKISVDSKYESNFKVEYSSGKDSWTIEIVKALNDTVLKAGGDLILTLTAMEEENNNVAQAALVIKLPNSNENEETPTFSGAYYLGEYKIEDNIGSVQMEKNIEITYTDMSEIAITLDSYTENFEVVYDNSEWTVNIKSPLTTDILNSYSQLIITLTATVTSDTTITSQSALVLKLPSVNTSEDLKFTKIVFEAEYVTNSTIPHVLGDDITVTNNKSAVQISVDSKYDSNFKIEYSSSKDSWTIAIENVLNDTVLKAGGDLILTLTATEEGSGNSAQAALVIKLPSLDEYQEEPKFSDAYYLAEYKLDESNKPFVEVKTNIEISNKESMSAIDISLDSYTTNLAVEWDSTSKAWKIDVSQPIDDNTLQFYTELILVMTAKEESNSNTGNSVLILTLPTKSDNSTDEVPIFSQIYYSAEYLSNDTLNMSDVIKVKSVGNESDVSIRSSSNSENFDIELDEDHYHLTVKTPLPSDVLQNEVSVVLTLEAKTGNASAYATVIINLPKATQNSTQNVPAFSQIYYSGDYSSTDVVEISDTISVTYEGGDVSVSVRTSTYSDNFEIQPDGDHYALSVKTPLSEEVIQSEISIVITLVAEDVTNAVSGYATVVINLPIKVNTSVITFGSVLYNVEYNPDNDELNVATLSVSVGSEEDLEVALSDELGLASYFNATYSDGSISIKLKDALPDSVVKSNSFIPLKLTATVKGTTDTTSVVVNVRIVGGGSGTNSGATSSGDTTGYIAAISVLAVLLIAVIAAVIVLWYLKIRTRSYSRMDDSPPTQVKFSKNLNRQSSELKSPSAIETRRPTGFVFTPTIVDAEANELENNQESSSDFPETKERRKSVAFDPNVEKMHIERVNDGDGDSISNNEYTSDTEDSLQGASKDHQMDNSLTEATNVPETLRFENGNLNKV